MKSSSPSSSLRFSNRLGDYFDLALETPNLSMTTRIFIYTYASTDGFVEFFESLASFIAPWSHQEKWKTLEGDLKLTATCSAMGHVKIETSVFNEADDWSVKCSMLFDFGSLPKFASDAKLFHSVQK